MKQLSQVEVRAAARLQGLIHLAFSYTSKMPCRSYSNQAGIDCVGSRERNPETGDMEVLPSCIACFAKSGHYRYESTKAVRQFNSQEWRHPDFVEAMVKELLRDLYFRWFDSGDINHIGMARKLYLVMLYSPHCQFWLPTQTHRVAKFVPILEAMNRLPNCTVRYSSGSVMGDTLETTVPQSIIYKEVSEIPATATVCNAYHHTNSTPTCGDCRACWDPEVSIVAYHGHGQAFNKAYAEEQRRKSIIPAIQIAA